MRKLIIAFTALLAVSMIRVLAGCDSGAGVDQPWTNFEWTFQGQEMVSLEDSTVLPIYKDYEAIIRVDSSYLYLKNISHLTVKYYDLSTGEEGLISGRVVYNRDDYFRYTNDWSYEEKKWKVVIFKMGKKDEMIEGDCIGFDSNYIVVENGSERRVYTYNLSRLSVDDTGIECDIEAPAL